MADSSTDNEILHCPTCGAQQLWSDVCRRCKCDLSLVHQLLRWRRELHRRALREIHQGRLDEALKLARQMRAIAADDDAARLLAVCHLLREDFPAALEVQQIHFLNSAPDLGRR